MDQSNKVAELVNLIAIHAKMYYEGLDSIQIGSESYIKITDREFDNLVATLSKIDPQNSILSTTGFGYSPDKDRFKRNHFSEVSGISRKTKSDNFAKSMTTTSEYSVLTPKLDGASVVIKYENGQLRYALSRGNGLVGVDVTEIIRQLPSVPSTISDQGELHIRGELVNISSLDNMRNKASGLIMRINYTLKDDEKESYVFVPYKVLNFYGENPKSLELDFLSGQGFIRIPQLVVKTSELHEYWNSSKEFIFESLIRLRTDEVLLPIDGIIIESETQDELIAFKTDSEVFSTTVTKINWKFQTSTGKYFPTIYFDPVMIDGSKVKKCSGGSYKKIQKLGLGIGAKIEVIKTGGIIPHITSVTEPSYEIDSTIPSDSYLDGANLFRKDYSVDDKKLIKNIFMRFVPKGSGVDLYNRSAQRWHEEFDDLVKFKDLMNSLNNGSIVNCDNIYLTTKNQLNNFLSTMKSISSYKVNLIRLLSLCSIDGLGPKLNKKLSGKFNSLKELIYAVRYRFKISEYSNRTVEASIIENIDNLVKIRIFFNDHKELEAIEVNDQSESVNDENLTKVILTNLQGSPLTKAELKSQYSGKVKFVDDVKKADIVVYMVLGSSKCKQGQVLGKTLMNVTDFMSKYS